MSPAPFHPLRAAGAALVLAGLAACAVPASSQGVPNNMVPGGITPGGALPAAPGNYSALLGQAESLYQGERYQQALDVFRRAAEQARGRDTSLFDAANRRASASWCMWNGQIARAAVERNDHATAVRHIQAVINEPGCETVPNERSWAQGAAKILGMGGETER